MDKVSEHHCIPRVETRCPQCGEMRSRPVFCTTCGADIPPRHKCVPHPVSHVCPPQPDRGRCLTCGEHHPAPLYCTTCGADITPSHRCPAAPATHVHRADPVHRCPAYKLERCTDCGGIKPELSFCSQCGMDTTPQHTCQPGRAPHSCPPVITMPKRCSSCGELKPAPQHCPDCGKETTPQHACR